MAVSIIGHPQITTCCPNCGSINITTNDLWHQDGLMICYDCGCRCYIIEAE
jgi:hypothetical protein